MDYLFEATSLESVSHDATANEVETTIPQDYEHFQLSQSTDDIKTLYKEWFVGINGAPSVKSVLDRYCSNMILVSASCYLGKSLLSKNSFKEER